jgi:hypothetical protein
VTKEQERKMEVLTFTDKLRAAGVAKVMVSYYGDGDEGRAEPPQFQDTADNPLEESRLSGDLDIRKLGDLLEGFAPEGYEDGRLDLPQSLISGERNCLLQIVQERAGVRSVRLKSLPLNKMGSPVALDNA